MLNRALLGVIAGQLPAGGGGGGGGTLNEAILALGPLAYYRFNESGGATLFDYSGMGINLPYSGSPVFNRPSLDASSSDPSTDFNGVTSADMSAFGPSESDFTFEFLLGAVSGTGRQRIMDFQGANHYILWVNFPSAGQISLYSNGLYISTTVDFGVAHHFVFEYANGTVDGHKLYVDGALRGTLTHTFGGTGINRVLGKRRDSATEWLNARIDEFVIYGAPLTPTQIQQHAQLAGYLAT